MQDYFNSNDVPAASNLDQEERAMRIIEARWEGYLNNPGEIPANFWNEDND